MGRPDPSMIVDREGDLAAFATMLTLDSPQRVMVVSDRRGRGKTDLLRKLRHQCEWRNPPVSAALFDFEARGVTTDIEIVECLAEQLRDAAGGLELANYERLSQARLIGDVGKFAQEWSVMSGSINLTSAQLSGEAQAAGIINNIHIEHVASMTTPEWNEALDKHARRLCKEAFFSDLLEATRESPVVLIFDTVNSADQDMRRWLVNELLRRRLLANWQEHHLLLILAGTDVDQLLEPLVAMSEGARLLPASPLHEWGPDEVRAFLAAHGIDGFVDKEVESIQNVIAAGLSLVKALQIAELMKEPTP